VAMTTFPLFPTLPFELRDQIWHDAFPESIGPALYFYRGRGCWAPRVLVEGDPTFRPDHPGDLAFEFRTELLGQDSRWEIALAFVNWEARRIAVAWLRAHDIEMRPQKDGRPPLFVRPFQPDVDTLYVARDKWEAFCSEPTDRMSEPDLTDTNVDLGSTLVQIAIPEELFFDSEKITWIPELGMWFEHLKVVFVVIGPQPELDTIPVPWRWKLKGRDGPSFHWNKDNQEFEFHDRAGDICDKALYEKIGYAANRFLREPVIEQALQHLEIRPVFTVRR